MTGLVSKEGHEMKGMIEEEEGVAPSRRKGMVSFGEELVRQPCWYEYGITDIQKPVRESVDRLRGGKQELPGIPHSS